MKKKVFITGKVYDLGTLGVNEVENAVQADLDKFFNAGGVKFKLREVSEKTLELTFLRKYRKGEIDWLNYDPKLIYNIDANIITRHSFNGFKVPDYWGGVPFGYTFSMPKREFIKCYRNSAILLGADQVKKVKITAQPEKVIIKLMF
ncbi:MULTISPECIES: hypothetical protein [Bacteroides]|uniref:hypothetical protein n=1 Tax=Bacteroides TaxID=816 RepID=UPI001CCFFBEA|nr:MULTISPECIES: hypothetical protein [Bacteroides]MCS2549060.1 hypothetical protein [Bacteroides faecis]UBE43348.1 hypothetical protein K6V30_13860 [Bacteroides faecis]GFZ40853.1 hypothetical protein BANORC5_28880 [Bacteroides nordii]